MKQKTKQKIVKIIILILAVLIIIGVISNLFPIIKDLNTKEGQIAFKEIISNSKIEGFLILFVLQIVQIIFAFIPGEPIEILAGVCFGSLWGTIFIMISIFISTLVIYLLVKRWGKKFIALFFSEESINKIENSKLLKNKKKIEIIMIILFLIPGTPKDLLVYIGGLLPIKEARFLMIATLLRFPSVLSSTIAGDNLIEGRWIISLIAYIVTFLLTFLFIIIFNRFDKDKITDDVIKSIKEKEL